LGGSFNPSPTEPFANEGSPWDAWWRFSPDLLISSGVVVVIVVVDPRPFVPVVNLCLFLLHSLITVAYSRLREFYSTSILALLLVCVRNNPTLVATLRIWWFMKPFTYQTIFQWRSPLGGLVEVEAWRIPFHINTASTPCVCV